MSMIHGGSFLVRVRNTFQFDCCVNEDASFCCSITATAWNDGSCLLSTFTMCATLFSTFVKTIKKRSCLKKRAQERMSEHEAYLFHDSQPGTHYCVWQIWKESGRTVLRGREIHDPDICIHQGIAYKRHEAKSNHRLHMTPNQCAL